MKRIVFTIIGLAMFSLIANAQKIGYCQMQKIIQLMPEYELAQAKLEGEMQDMQTQAEEMQVEFNNKYKSYTENVQLPAENTKKWSPAILQVKEQELTQLQQRLQEFQATASENLQKRQLQLLEPISTKLDSVINIVMTEKGYSFIIKELTVIQVNKNKCDDITPQIKQKLKLQ